MEYCTLAELKTFLKIHNNIEDGDLQNLIMTCTSILDLEIGWNLEVQTITRRLSGMGTERIILEGDVNSIEYIRYFKNITSGDYVEVKEVFRDGPVVTLDRVIQKGRKNIEIRYTKGFEQVPTDMKAFFLKYCREMYEIYKDTINKVKTKKIEGLSVTYFSPGEIMEMKSAAPLNDFTLLLKKYKNFTPIHY